MKADREADFADAKIDIFQKRARFFDSGAGHIIDKVYAGYLLELLTQVVRTDIDRFRDLGQRKLLVRMLLDELSRFPDLYRLSMTQLSSRLSSILSQRHHHAALEGRRVTSALRALPIGRRILLLP